MTSQLVLAAKQIEETIFRIQTKLEERNTQLDRINEKVKKVSLFEIDKNIIRKDINNPSIIPLLCLEHKGNVLQKGKVFLRFTLRGQRIESLTQLNTGDQIGSGSYKIIYLAEKIDYKRKSILGPFQKTSTPFVVSIAKKKKEAASIRAGYAVLRLLFASLTEEERRFFVPPPIFQHISQQGFFICAQPFYFRYDLFQASRTEDIPIRASARTEKLSLKELLQLYRDAAHALSLVHQNKIVHGDARPDNFLIDQDSRGRFVRLHDWDLGGPQRVVDYKFMCPPFSFCYLKGLVTFEADTFVLISHLFYLAFKEKSKVFWGYRDRLFTHDVQALILDRSFEIIAMKIPFIDQWKFLSRLDKIKHHFEHQLREIARRSQINLIELKHRSMLGIHDSLQRYVRTLELSCFSQIKEARQRLKNLIDCAWEELKLFVGAKYSLPPVQSELSLEEVDRSFRELCYRVEDPVRLRADYAELVKRVAAHFQVVVSGIHAVDLFDLHTRSIADLHMLLRGAKEVLSGEPLQELLEILPNTQVAFENIVQQLEGERIPVRAELGILSNIAGLMKEAVEVDQWMMEEAHQNPLGDFDVSLDRLREKMIEQFGRNCLDITTLKSRIEGWISQLY